MVIFNKIMEKIVDKTEVTSMTVTEQTIQRVIPAIKKKTVLGDILDDPENFKLEAYFEGNGLVIKVEPKSDYVVYSQ